MLEIKPIKSDKNVFQRPKNLCRQYLENQARATVVSTLVSAINSWLPYVNHALISPILPHPVV